jgi:hypothetical protein
MDRKHNIPNDLAECQRRLIETQHVAEETAASYESLVGEHERLQEELATLKRMLFGPRRERMTESPDQQYLFERGPPQFQTDTLGIPEKLSIGLWERGGSLLISCG